MSEDSSVFYNQGRPPCFWTWIETLLSFEMADDYSALCNEGWILYPWERREILSPFGRGEDSSALWNEGGVFLYALEWGKILTSCEMRRDSSAFWSEGRFLWYWERGKLLPSLSSEGGVFRPLKGRMIHQTKIIIIIIDSSILWNEKGLFRLLKWRRVPLSLGMRIDSSIFGNEMKEDPSTLWNEGGFQCHWQ